MLAINTPCHIAIPNPENRRVLVPGKVLELPAGRCVAAFEQPVTLPPGTETFLYAEWRGKFHQQAARVAAVRTEGPTPVLELERIGEPVNCESRGCYRVSVVSQELTVELGRIGPCLLADVSAEGVSIITPRRLQIGASVQMDLLEENVRATGSLRVQSEKELPGGKMRYGLHAPESRSMLRRSLEALSVLMQRRQLKRLAGAA